MKLGITGTCQVLTVKQNHALHQLIRLAGATELHHGDCKGADAAVHTAIISRRLNSREVTLPGIRLIIHPPASSTYQAFCEGAEIKVGIRGLCAELGGDMDHEVFVHTGPGYYSTERRIFCAGAQPAVRVKPSIPLGYESRGWDFGWLMPRTDGFVARWLCDPYTLKFGKSEGRHPLRWFVR